MEVVLTPEEMSKTERDAARDLAAIEAYGPYANAEERSYTQRHLNVLFAPKEAPNGCEQCGAIYEAFGDYPDGEYGVGRAGNPCQNCRAAYPDGQNQAQAIDFSAST